MKKRHCHCGFHEHLGLLRARKLGLVGVTLFVLHLLFHVVECLIVPSIIVGLGGHLAEDSAAATSGEQIVTDEVTRQQYIPRYDFSGDGLHSFDRMDFYQIRST